MGNKTASGRLTAGF